MSGMSPAVLLSVHLDREYSFFFALDKGNFQDLVSLGMGNMLGISDIVGNVFNLVSSSYLDTPKQTNYINKAN